MTTSDGRMTGFDEAAEWLRVNANDWRIVHSESHLRAGLAIGDPTWAFYEVTLANGTRYEERTITLVGRGTTFLGAVKAAMDALER